ncbi:putative metalloprotease CJM1_0395 family protein [Salinimonas chungwhensis]|uniref:putative metalloprotease CJM1_0395 family protein n=1 Tax=Salinimonas chungwhensis TaxID=265425 RepID=UPI0003625F33|nr:putative metalloprotease CJM1_0395 family protein [Salinimonas chungwhensis]
MNIAPAFPSVLASPSGNLNTEAARRENVLQETIPKAAGSEPEQAGQGPGSDSDRTRQPAASQHAVTYEKPVTVEPQDAGSGVAGQSSKNNSSEEQSAGREQAEQRQQEQQAEQKVAELEKRDREVRIHEEAHRAAGGQYASAPQYEYTTGPDNKRYATGGEVSIDVSKEKTPAETIQKMEQVRKAALAPAEPSSQDRKVASEAAQAIAQARSELAQERTDEQNGKAPSESANPLTERMARIQFTYRQAYTPKDAGFQTSA